MFLQINNCLVFNKISMLRKQIVKLLLSLEYVHHSNLSAYILGFFAKQTQNSKSTTKLTYIFLDIFLSYPPHKFRLFMKIPLNFYFILFFKNDIFTLSTSTTSSIYKIVIVFNTPTTMNNQFEALNLPQIDLHFFFLNSYELKTTSLSLSLHIHPKNPRF